MTNTQQTDIAPNYKTREGATARINELVPAIARALGFTVEPDTRDPEDRHVSLSHFKLSGPDSQSLYLSAGYPYGKLTVGVLFPERINGASVWSLPYGTNAPTISCTLSKSAEQVARDIQRRIIPAYLPLLADCKKRVAETLEYRDERKRAAEGIARLIGATVRYDRNSSDPDPRIDVFHSTKLPEAAIDLKVYPDEVNFERLRVSHDEAAAILTLLVKSRAKKGGK